MNHPIDDLGGTAAVARLLGVAAPSVTNWRKGKIPVERAPQIERASKGAHLCEVMRPDVRWLRIPDPFWPHPAGRPVIDVAGEHQPGDGAVSAGPQMSDRAQAVT